MHVPCLLLEESDGSLSCSHRWMILECCMFGFGEVWWLAELLALLDDLSLSVCVLASSCCSTWTCRWWVALGLSASGSPTYVPSAIPIGRLVSQTLYKVYLKAYTTLASNLILAVMHSHVSMKCILLFNRRGLGGGKKQDGVFK